MSWYAFVFTPQVTDVDYNFGSYVVYPYGCSGDNL
jgi:hypothetical protein